ncbi:MAG: lipid-binding SYLF domain-containing protein [Alphaproteobacteria bacterium]|jgi:SH3 domain-containing YSC84-like protein 1|nr:lipid-binding SYLF domain-containing protein [Rhodospirillaceae bacterium]MBT7615553.1 lipid-binding SYLF domain-containing protein [Rhodospirillaceae bacterium]MDG2479565.1 lipid-binding SYLF domain-containing protein [Alphaproteobacteria bacterium]
MTRYGLTRWIVSVVVFVFLTVGSRQVRAEGEETVVDDAAHTVVELLRDPDFANLEGLLDRAHGVVIVPQLIKAGFIIGGEAGRGVILAHDLDTGTWSNPAFLDVGAASIGLQIGASETQVVLAIMTDAGLEAMLAENVEVGAEASVAAGPVGAEVKAATTSTEFNQDIYAYGTSEGLFLGVAIEGTLLIPDQDANMAYYGQAATTREIIQAGKVWNGHADQLREILRGET